MVEPKDRKYQSKACKRWAKEYYDEVKCDKIKIVNVKFDGLTHNAFKALCSSMGFSMQDYLTRMIQKELVSKQSVFLFKEEDYNG